MESTETFEESSHNEVENKMLLSYPTSFFDNFSIVTNQARDSRTSNQAITSLLESWGSFEEQYGKAIGKLVKDPPPVINHEWASSVKNKWIEIFHLFQNGAKEQREFAKHVLEKISPSIKVFSMQHAGQVQRLRDEGSKIQVQYQKLEQQHTKAKKSFERKCQEAHDSLLIYQKAVDDDRKQEEIINNQRQVPSSATTSQLLSKVWDNTTAAFARPSVEKLRGRADALLDEVKVKELEYRKSVETLNAGKITYNEKMKENLHAFQLTEEQRIDYTKDCFLRLSTILCAKVENYNALLKDYLVCTSSISYTKDVDNAFKSQNVVKLNESKVSLEKLEASGLELVEVLKKAQSRSDKGQAAITSSITFFEDFIGYEDFYTNSISKLLRGAGSSSNNSNSNTMQQGIDGLYKLLQSFVTIHLETQSLLSDPVTSILQKLRTETTGRRRILSTAVSHSCHSFTKAFAEKNRMQSKLESSYRELEVLSSSRTEDLSSSVESTTVAIATTAAPSLASPSVINNVFSGLKESSEQRKTRLDEKLKNSKIEVENTQQEVIRLERRCQKAYEDLFNAVVQITTDYQEIETQRLEVLQCALKAVGTTAMAHQHKALQASLDSFIPTVEKMNAESDISDFIRQSGRSDINSSSIQTVLVDIAVSSLVKEAMHDRKIDLIDEEEAKSFDEEEEELGTKVLPMVVVPKDDGSNNNNSTTTADDNDYEEVLLHKKFKISSEEQFASALKYVCAWYQGNIPYHGRIFMTQNYLCFEGWKNSVVVVPYSDITGIEKKAMLMTPTAIEVETTSRGKLFFASFILSREECYQTMTQLWQAGRQMTKIMNDDDDDDDDSPIEIDESMKQYEILFEKDLMMSLSDVFTKLYESDSTYAEFLTSCGESDVNVQHWKKEDTTEDAEKMRHLSYRHHKKYLIGPSSVPTTQCQRYYFNERQTQLVMLTTSTVSDVPYHDYFRVEIRCVYQQSATCDSRTQMLVGVRVHFLKSTWVKKQIESTALSETKEGMLRWVDFANEKFGNKAVSKSSKRSGAEAVVESSAQKKLLLSLIQSVMNRVSEWNQNEWALFFSVIIHAYFLYLLVGIKEELRELSSIVKWNQEQQENGPP